MRRSEDTVDLVIRGGTIVDGTGAPGFQGDVAISGDRIVAVGDVCGATGREELDATGLVVAPGFIDAHSHMDAQVFWDDLGMPVCWHGVTSVVMGNCGFTVAPTNDDARELVVRCLERAEDIPASAMSAGLPWSWQSYAEYLDAVETTPKGVNYAGSIGHSALRTFVMGERAFDEDATRDDMEAMARELRSALAAGAAGFSTSRSRGHATSDGRPVASRRATWEEVSALVDIVGHESNAIFQLAQERHGDSERQREWLDRFQRLAIESGAPIVFGMFASTLTQVPMEFVDETAALGGEIFVLTHSRNIVSTQSFRSHLAFDKLPEWQDLRRRPEAEQKVMLRDPEVRARLVHAAHHGDYGIAFGPEARKPDYEHLRVLLTPYPGNPSVAEEARRRGVDPAEALIDIALEHDFDVLFMEEIVNQDEEQLLRLLRHPRTAMGFSDSGAHVSQIFDASIYSHLLGYWVRERGAIGLEEAIQMITSRPADMWRLADRGRLAPGQYADVTVFDPQTVGPLMPELVSDVPGGTQRFEQRASGFAATIVNGTVLTRDGEATAARPGRLLRASALA
jgi:N-acyl-D-amino-acid deacylase